MKIFPYPYGYGAGNLPMPIGRDALFPECQSTVFIVNLFGSLTPWLQLLVTCYGVLIFALAFNAYAPGRFDSPHPAYKGLIEEPRIWLEPPLPLATKPPETPIQTPPPAHPKPTPGPTGPPPDRPSKKPPKEGREMHNRPGATSAKTKVTQNEPGKKTAIKEPILKPNAIAGNRPYPADEADTPARSNRYNTISSDNLYAKVFQKKKPEIYIPSGKRIVSDTLSKRPNGIGRAQDTDFYSKVIHENPGAKKAEAGGATKKAEPTLKAPPGMSRGYRGLLMSGFRTVEALNAREHIQWENELKEEIVTLLNGDESCTPANQNIEYRILDPYRRNRVIILYRLMEGAEKPEDRCAAIAQALSCLKRKIGREEN